jgi:rhodanese-related sulfurtransferase
MMKNWLKQSWQLLFIVIIVQIPTTGNILAAKVNITRDMPYVDVRVKGKTYRIQRIQDTKNKLTNSFSKTSRPCPPFCIHPISVARGVDTVGEIEVIQFLKDKVEVGKGVLVDARIPAFYKKGTIPGSVNIPFTLLSQGNSAYLNRILSILGAVKDGGGQWNFSNARDLLLYCNGPWCDQSPRAIRGLLSAGFPNSKLLYYRGGMQNWQALGLTTVKP